MRLSSPLSLGSLALASSAWAATRHGLVHIPLPERSSPTSPSALSSVTLSPSEARLVLAHRLGVSQYHNLDDVDQYTLQAINDFGSESLPATDPTNRDHQRSNLIMVIEGIHDPENFIGSSNSQSFKIENPPAPDDNTEFLQALSAQQSKSASDKSSSYRHDHHCSLNDIKTCIELWASTGQQPPIYHSKSLQDLAKSTGGPSSSLYRSESAKLKQTLVDLLSAKSSSVDLTVLLMPLELPSSRLFNLFPSTPPSWGPAHNALARRQLFWPAETTTSSSDSDSTSTETTTSPSTISSSAAEETTSSTTTSSTSTSTFTSTRTSTSSLATNTSPPKGILQVCYTSREACEKTTHSCSGHGECQELYTLPDTSDKGHTCYACACQATKEETGNGGTRTTLWAGPACQKKDITIPFWLLAGATVGLVSTVAWGIGVLVEMGSKDLPGVLSAGVVGLGARGK